MAYATIPKEKLKLVKRIAQGSFGTVYKAVWYNGGILDLWSKQQVVAAKRVDKEEGEQEYKFLSELEHPNIVKLIGMVDNEVDVDIILEFCDGGSLRSYLDEHRGTKLGQLFFDWTKQAGRPIAFLKEKGVVHKDIKSPNYLITSSNILKLCDFGLAKKVDTTMTSATERASYPWMAPELLKDSTLSPSYDIFAYGVVVWELWKTDPPFEGCESANLIYRICVKNERLPIPPDCPTQIADLMKQCWETDWKKRPSMEQALSMVESAAQDTFKKAIVARHPWELESRFGHQDVPGELRYARDIAVCPNGDTAVLDNSEDYRVCVYSNETVYKFRLELRQGLTFKMASSSHNVTVNAHGIFYVTVKHFVLMFTKHGVYKGKWVTMSPDKKPSDTRLCGLTIDNNGQVLVGQICSSRYISRHREDGSHIGSIKVSIAPWYLAVTSHDTIVISDCDSAVQIVDSTGHVLHILNANRQVSFWNPRGIDCYSDIIFVCNTDKKEISCFSASAAEYLGSIPVNDRFGPIGVAMAKGGQLLVACGRSGVFVYRKKWLTV